MDTKAHGYGTKIRELRLERELSRRQVAERSGVTGQYIYLIETGRATNPSIQVLERVASALGVRLSSLID